MAVFDYKARDIIGKAVSGIIEAEDEVSAASNIEKSGLSPISISRQNAPIGLRNIFSRQFQKVSRQEVLVFTRQLAALIATGNPLIQSLDSVAEQTRSIRFKQIIQNMVTSLRQGKSFSESLSAFGGVFTNLYVSLIRVGEAGGLLDKVLSRLADLSTQEIDLRSRLRSALVYPAVLALVAFVIVNFVLIGVLPKFVAIFEASSARIPLPTKVLLSASFILRKFWWLLGIMIILGLSGLRRFYRSEAGRLRLDSRLLHLPVFGPFILKIMVSRLSRSVAALTQAGVPLLDALTVVEETIPNVALKRTLADIRLAISGGQSLTQPFKVSGLFSPIVIQLIDTGERTGKLDRMFDQIADFYEPEIEFTMRNLTSLLEPIMLLGMGALVAFIALSVLLPIFNLINIVRR